MPSFGAYVRVVKSTVWLKFALIIVYQIGGIYQVLRASCDLTRPDVEETLQSLVQRASPERIRGVRWSLDCVGKFEPDTATHIATTRHDGIEYLRGSEGGYSGTTVPAF